MVLLDLGCSQPTILNSLMTTETYKIPLYLLNNGLYNYNDIRKDIYLGGVSSQTYNGKNPVNTRLSALVASNELYSRICDINGWEWNAYNKLTAKQFFFSCIYGQLPHYNKETNTYKKDEKRLFMEKHFQNVVRYVDSFKIGMIPYFKNLKENRLKEYNKMATKYENKKTRIRPPVEMASVSFSILMQRIESYLFINKALKELIDRSVPCIPKHDGVLVPLSYQEKATKVIRKHLDKYLGENCYNLVAKE